LHVRSMSLNIIRHRILLKKLERLEIFLYDIFTIFLLNQHVYVNQIFRYDA